MRNSAIDSLNIAEKLTINNNDLISFEILFFCKQTDLNMHFVHFN